MVTTGIIVCSGKWDTTKVCGHVQIASNLICLLWQVQVNDTTKVCNDLCTYKAHHIKATKLRATATGHFGTFDVVGN